MKYDLALFCIALGAGDGIELGGILGNAGYNCALRQGEILELLVEVALCGHLDTKSIAPEVDRVEVVGDDELFVHRLFQLDGEILLLKLALQLRTEALLASAVEDIIFDKLLRDGGAASGGGISRQYACRRTQDGTHIYAVVLPEARVLYGDEGIDHILRYLVICCLLPVGAGHDESIGHIARRVVYSSRVAQRGDAGYGDVRGIVDDALDKTDAQTCAEDAAHDQHDHSELEYDKYDFV